MKAAVRKFKETVEIQSTLFNKIRSHRYYRPALLVSFFLMISFFHIWQRVTVVKLVHEVGLLNIENREILDKKKKLYSNIARLSSSSRIQSYASDTLGLRLVSADNMLTLKLKDNKPKQVDELEMMFSAFQRMTEYLPVIEETKAQAGVIEDITLDSTVNGWDRR